MDANAELRTLQDYAAGVISRATAMRALELDWYGDLLLRVRAAGLNVAPPSPEDRVRMNASLAAVVGDGATHRAR